MAMPNKDQWAEIEKLLDRMYCSVYLLCDGYLVEATLRRVAKNNLAIEIYVNGYIRGEWFGLFDKPEDMSEETRRFYMPRQKKKYSAKELKFYEKFYGKRVCRKKGMYDSWIIPKSHWRSAKSFIAHLKKHNSDIRVICADEHKARLDLVMAEQKTEEAAHG